MARASASVRLPAMLGPPMNELSVANMAIGHLVRLGLATKPGLSSKSDFVSVMFLPEVNYDDLHRDKYDNHHSQGLIDA